MISELMDLLLFVKSGHDGLRRALGASPVERSAESSMALHSIAEDLRFPGEGS